MIPGKFEYFAPNSIPEAITLLQQYPGEAKVLAGGQSLIPLMKFRLASPGFLVDLKKITGLNTITEQNGHLAIGCMVTEAALDQSALVRQRYPAVWETTRMVADPLVRNFATVGGNLAHGDPANDHPATMLALRAEVVLEGPNGRRTLPVADFLVDTLETALEPDELLMEIHIPRPGEHEGSAYIKLERKVGDYAIAGVAARVRLANGVCAEAGLGLTNVGPVAIQPKDAEQFLVGKPLNEANILEAANLSAAAAQPSTDLRGPAEYKRAMVRTLTVRALRLATQRATEG